jgi:hypothetical protein
MVLLAGDPDIEHVVSVQSPTVVMGSALSFLLPPSSCHFPLQFPPPRRHHIPLGAPSQFCSLVPDDGMSGGTTSDGVTTGGGEEGARSHCTRSFAPIIDPTMIQIHAAWPSSREGRKNTMMASSTASARRGEQDPFTGVR